MNGTLYRIINTVNNKSYIGKTYNSIYVRLKNHLNCKEDRPLYRAFRKYGADKFTLEILGEFPEGDLEKQEELAIIRYNSYSNGYNATVGGDGKRYLVLPEQDIIDSYINSNKSIKFIADHYKVDWHSIEKILLSAGLSIESNIDRIRRIARKIRIIDINEVFDNTYECAKFLIESDVSDSNIKTIQQSISRVCSGDRKTYKGLSFEYYDSGTHDRLY